MNSQLVINALVSKATTLCDFLKLVQDCRCHVVETRMSTLGLENAIAMLVRGNWDGVAKLETVLNNHAKKHGYSLMFKRTEARKYEANLLPYLVQAISVDKPGIALSVLQFFIKQKYEIQKFKSSTFSATPTQTNLGSVSFTVLIPAQVQIAELRENFIIFCDELNIDAILEPAKYAVDE